MEIVINIVIWYFIGYVLSMIGFYLTNQKAHLEECKIPIKEALALSVFSWVILLVVIGMYFELGTKADNIIESLNKKFKGEKE